LNLYKFTNPGQYLLIGSIQLTIKIRNGFDSLSKSFDQLIMVTTIEPVNDTFRDGYY